ncbi:hypothetical protein GCM10027614_27140 [Micromonospora vulcania]
MVYRYFYDCEFIEDGQIVDLVSIGVVDEYGREFYAVSTEFDDSRAVPWVRRNVLDKLPPRRTGRGAPGAHPRRPVRLPGRTDPGPAGEQLELWAWYAAYDHVVLAQLWGAMPALPREIPGSPRSCGRSGTTGAGPPCRTRTRPGTTPWSTPGTTWPAGGR